MGKWGYVAVGESGIGRLREITFFLEETGQQQAERTAVRAAPSVCPRGKPTVSGGENRLCRRGAPARGLTRRLRRERWGCRPQGDRTFFRSERKYQRKPAARRLQRRPTSLCTAAKPCAALGLGYALHGFQPFLALVGLRPPLAVGFGLR